MLVPKTRKLFTTFFKLSLRLLSVFLQETWNTLKLQRKKLYNELVAQTLLTRKDGSYRCANCDPNSPELQKNLTRPHHAQGSQPPNREDGLMRKVNVCPSVTLAAWVLHWSTLSIKILILAMVVPFYLLSSASLVGQPLPMRTCVNHLSLASTEIRQNEWCTGMSVISISQPS